MMLRTLVLCLVIDAAAGCGDSPRPADTVDAGDDAPPSVDAAAPDAPAEASAATGRLRLVHVAPVAGAIDIYVSGRATPLFTGLAYGAATDYAPLPVGAVRFEARETGAAPTS